MRHCEQEYKTGVCSECGRPCEAKPMDFGIGPYEFWGDRGTHHDWRLVSPCCEAEVVDPPEPEEEEEEE